MASCAESGCPQVRQTSGARLSARTVGESLCMSKSVKAHYKGQIVSTRDLPTGCQQQCSLVVPTVRAPRCLTEPSAKSHQKQPTKRPEREPSAGRRVGCLAQEEYSKPAPEGRDESLRKLHESLVHNSQHATQQGHGQQNRSGIHQARRSVWPRRRVREKEKLMRSSSVRASSSRSRACSMLTPELPGPDPENLDNRAVIGAGFADRCDAVRGRTNPGWFGCGALAVSGEVDDGRGG
jgi:hypothetical protein